MEATRRLFTVSDYYRMAEAGVIRPDERVELIEGEIIRMNPIGPPHANCVDRLTALFVAGLGDRATVRIQNPVRLGELSEPEPDVALVRRGRDLTAHPGPADIHLLTEVADTSVDFDRRVKLPLYARAGVAEVWIIDLVGSVVEVYRSPQAGGYRDLDRFGAGDTIAPAAFPDVRFRVEDILGPS